MSEVELYQKLHDTNGGYQNNNWLLDQLDFIKSLGLGSIVEIGCGNGKFTSEIVNYVPCVIGVDLVRSPLLKENFRFVQADLYQDNLPFTADLVVSADVMEHFVEDKIPEIMSKLLKVSDKQFHIIACYDDNVSHKTIKTPAEWLKLFTCISDNFRLVWIKERKGREICLISNL